MSGDPSHRELDEQTRRELAGLADGTLEGYPRAELEARLAGSPALRAALQRQRAGATALRELDLEAPTSLRARIAADSVTSSRRPPRGRTSRRRLAIGGALAGAVAAAALAAVLVLSTSSEAPTVREASRLAERPPTGPVAADPYSPKLLAANVEGVPFPNWSKQFGWRQAGIRSDHIGDRDARTVFYRHDGKRIAYTIVSGAGIAAPSDASTTRRNGVTLHSLADSGRRVVTWWRNGRTCVLSASNVGDHELLKLASWKGDGAVPF
jgi:anti-sigma factor RsiW